MTRTKHVFRQDVPCLHYAALGDTAVRIIAIQHLITAYCLDAIIVPPRKEALLPLWADVFGADRVFVSAHDIPNDYRQARVSAPTNLDWSFGTAGWNVFESVMWENGFFDTARLKITPPVIYPANHRSRGVMIYPSEQTDGNRVYDSDWWIGTCRLFREQGYALNHLGGTSNSALRKLYDLIQFDRTFEPSIAGLRDCVAVSSLAIGGSTGPTWALLLSDIRQIVLESKQSPHGYWFFDRCQNAITKHLDIVTNLKCLIPTAT